MLRTIRHHDVTELRFSSWRSRLSGMRVSAFLVRGVLIDAAFPSLGPALARWVRAHSVRGVALTHAHEDHAGGAPLLARAGIPLWMSASTREKLRAPAPVRFYRRFSWGSPGPLGASEPFTLPAGLHPVATPGHADDHHVFWDAETESIFGGDLFIGVKVRFAHPTEDPYATVSSLRHVIALRPRRYFDAHRGRLVDPLPLLAAKATWMEAVIAACERRIVDGEDDATIARRVLGADRLVRWYTAGDYTMANWVRGVRRGFDLRSAGNS